MRKNKWQSFYRQQCTAMIGRLLLKVNETILEKGKVKESLSDTKKVNFTE